MQHSWIWSHSPVLLRRKDAQTHLNSVTLESKRKYVAHGRILRLMPRHWNEMIKRSESFIFWLDYHNSIEICMIFDVRLQPSAEELVADEWHNYNMIDVIIPTILMIALDCISIWDWRSHRETETCWKNELDGSNWIMLIFLIVSTIWCYMS